MTVGSKMHQTLSSLEGAVSDLKTFALDTQDQTAKQQFSSYAQQLEGIVQGLRGRVNYVEQQEPTYKMQQQQQQRQ
ncbi:hypothetical protein SY88_19075 [Clostridiales bacterium PH28_bin88]|nr:hypothetical protein SY88_19075 [Clostridiales bacterium PH28_bin88]